MPEPISILTAGTIALYLADKIGGKAVEKSSENLWDRMKQWFKGEKFLSILEENPDSLTDRDFLAGKLDELIRREPATLIEIEQLLNRVPYGVVSNAANITGIGNLIFQNISNSTINATVTINHSGEYREYEEKLVLLQDLFESTPSGNREKRQEIGRKIREQKEILESFKQEILRLAETFDKIELDSVRLQKAKEHFKLGEITEARVFLEDAEEERADFVNRGLSKQIEYTDKILPGLQNAAAEYLVLAQATALNFDDPNRFDATCEYYRQSVRSFASFDNLFLDIFSQPTTPRWKQ